jgi:ABC-type enterobactin transport system permease subunit
MRSVLFLLLSFVLLAIFVYSICVGSSNIGFQEFFAYMSGWPSSQTTILVIRDIRLPRSLAALLTGSALGVSGGPIARDVAEPIG